MTKKTGMKGLRLIILCCVIVPALGFTMHKFYMSIYQLRFNQEKERLEITGRVFLDDLNGCISKYAKTPTHIGEKGQTKEDLAHLERYYGNHFRIKVDGKIRPMAFIGCETEENTVICYFRIDGIKKVGRLEVLNSAIMSCHPEQQNVIQAEISGTKKNLLLTEGETSGRLEFP